MLNYFAIRIDKNANNGKIRVGTSHTGPVVATYFRWNIRLPRCCSAEIKINTKHCWSACDRQVGVVGFGEEIVCKSRNIRKHKHFLISNKKTKEKYTEMRETHKQHVDCAFSLLRGSSSSARFCATFRALRGGYTSNAATQHNSATVYSKLNGN